MRVHFYGKLDDMESCYTFQVFDMNGVELYLQNAPRFGYEPATMTIKNPALFVKKENDYYRFVIEDFELEVVNGQININGDLLKDISEQALGVIR